MKLSKMVLFTACLTIVLIMIGTVTSNAMSQSLNNLDFNIDVHTNGDMVITETWDIYINDTNTLYKTFPLDGKYDNITDVTVSEIKNGYEYDFSKSYNYEYHVEKDYYQALLNPDGDFEIAWGVNVTGSSTNTYKITYTVKNHVAIYSDCAEIYWQLIGKDFSISADNITGTINLPDGIFDIEDVKVWAHGPLNGSIERVSTDKVSFQVEDLSSSDFLEIRLAVPTYVFWGSTKTEYSDKLDSIIQEETLWANEANEKRIQKQRMEKIMNAVTLIIGVLVFIFGISKMQKYKNVLSEVEKQKPEQDWDYFRDIPNEKASPGEASFLYYFPASRMMSMMSKIISATILNLSLKKWIEFEVDSSDKKKTTMILKETGIEELHNDEKLVYQYLKVVSKNTLRFTMKDFEKFSKSHVSDLDSLLKNISNVAEKSNVEYKNFDLELKKQNKKWSQSTIGYFVAIFLSFYVAIISPLLTLLIIIMSVINLSRLFRITNRINGLTQKGINEKAQWTGLYKFMKDFSMLDQREVPELALWEKYLVYATAFGIADKVLKQLKVRFPELQDESYMSSSHFAYMHIISHTNTNFINSINSSIGSSVNYSSSDGSGGGFSSGGGGGGGRTEAAVDANQSYSTCQTFKNEKIDYIDK